MRSRILALDLGEKRIGVAVSDALNITAQGVMVINHSSQKGTLDSIKGLVKEYDVGKIIVGIPINMDGSKGARAKSSEEFVSLLSREVPISVETVDERLTTAQGERVLLEADVSRRKRKRSIDKIAAQLMLQTYLDKNV